MKRTLVRLFTKNPFKVKPFRFFIEKGFGAAVDLPEDLTYILSHESGEPFGYQAPYFYNLEKCRKKYIGKSPRFKYNGLFKEPDRYVFSMADAHIIGPMGLVYDSKTRSFVEESGKEWIKPLKKSVYLNMISPPQVKNLEGITISFLTNGADGGFYHFLFESFVKLHFYGSLLAADHYLFNAPATNWKLKWLDKANIDRSKIIWVDNIGHFKCEQLLFTSPLVNDQQISNWALQSLKKLIKLSDPISKQGNKIIWLTRKNVKLRNILWEDKLLALFPNIIEVDFESMELENTIAIIKDASHIISPHGAALSNTFLCNEGTRILELYPLNETYKPCFARLSSISKLDHYLAFIDFNNDGDPDTGLDFLTRTISDFIKK